MNKLLFLDIDGVLNGHEKLPGSMYCGIKPECMAQLNRIVARTDCKLVLTSAWRYLIHGGCMNLKGMEYLLATHGLIINEGDPLLIDYARKDVSPQITDRGEQIMEWLAGSGFDIRQGAWAVVDDHREIITLGQHGWRVVETQPTLGLREIEANRLIDLLNGGHAP